MNKVTLLFQQGTLNKDQGDRPDRIAGWSESYYTERDPDAAGLKLMEDLCRTRARLLSDQGRIVGQRYQRVDPVGLARAYESNYVGVAGHCALPGKALEFRLRSPAGFNSRSLILRGIPDNRVVTGEYTSSSEYTAALRGFFSQLTRFWKFRGINRQASPVAITSLNSEGVLITPQARDWTEETVLRPYRCYASNGQLVTGDLVVVGTSVGNLTRTVVRKDGKPISAIARGKMRVLTIVHPTIEVDDYELTHPDAIFRKVGAPFEKFRGRR